MQEVKCKDCKDTGEILTEGVRWVIGYPDKSRPKDRRFIGDGEWKMVPCYCLSDKE